MSAASKWAAGADGIGRESKPTAASPAPTVHSTARDGAVHIYNKSGEEIKVTNVIIDIKETDIVAPWPEPTGSYYSRPWRGYVEVFGYTYGAQDAAWLRAARITSVEQGQAWVAENLYDGTYRIVDVGGNVYEEGRASGSPASA